MAIAQLPQAVAVSQENGAREWKSRANSLRADDKRWIRSLAATSLITGAVLLARGRRKAGFAATALGAAIAILENPEDLRTGWNRLPAYIEGGKRILNRLEGFAEDLCTQRDRLLALLEKVERR